MGYKAFDPGMICNGKQYAENTVFEEAGTDKCCQAGVMHYCEEPFDCLDYYPLANDNGKITEFAKVEPLAEVLTKGNKRATRKLRIGAKLSLKDFISAQVGVQMEKANNETAASGDRSKLAASGDWSKLAASGDGSKLAASGNWSQLAASGANSIAAAIGKGSVASAALGSWIVLAEYDEQNNPLCVRAAQIDGEKLKPNVFYRLMGGEFVEVMKSPPLRNGTAGADTRENK